MMDGLINLKAGFCNIAPTFYKMTATCACLCVFHDRCQVFLTLDTFFFILLYMAGPHI